MICESLRNLISFIQFSKKHSHRSVNSNTPPRVFFKLFKLYNWYHIAQSIAYYICVKSYKELRFDVADSPSPSLESRVLKTS